jgi:hypothetical protein
MKKLATIVALAGILISGPALAQSPQRNGGHNPAATNEPLQDGSVYWRGTKRGQDPDWFIRFQILRDAEAAHT